MPNSIWNGALSLGLVVVPVRLYPAIQKKTVRFRELDRDGHRVRHVRVSESEVEYEPMDRGLVFSKPELAARYEPREPVSRDFETPPTELGYEEIRKGFEVAPGQYVSMTRRKSRPWHRSAAG